MRYVKGYHIDIKEVAGKLSDKLNNTKRISKSLVSDEDIINVLQTIEIVNAMDEYETMLGGRLLSDYRIPNCFKPFLAPKKVALAVGSRYPDLRHIGDVSEYKPMTVNDLFDLSDKIAATFKVPSVSTFTFADREIKTFVEMKEAMIIRGDNSYVVPDGDSWFVPIGINSCVNDCVGEKVFTEDANYVLSEFLNRFAFVPQNK